MPPALHLSSLTKSYGDLKAVDSIDLEVQVGECFGLLGPNGAGKTTTIEICEGLLEPDSGEVTLLGRRWSEQPKELRQHLGIQLQETQLSEKITVEETLRLFRSFFRSGRSIEAVIALVQLEEKRKARVGTLSGGQKQRLAVACALVGDPQLLFLDEPTTGLDPQARRQLWDLVEHFRATGRTTVLTTHYMEEAERLCDRVAIMDHGRIIAIGTPTELINSLGAEHVVEFAAEPGAGSEAPALEPAMLGSLAGVLRARVHDGQYQLHVSSLRLAVPSLLAELARRSVGLAELRTHSATLEDVFVNLTGRHLRDE